MNKKNTTAFAASRMVAPLIALLAFAPHVKAEEVDEIIVSATGIPTPAAQIGASVDVITAEDLERQQITYLQDALKRKGINIPQSGGTGTLSNVFLRGLPGKYTDLVVDGISMYDPRSEQVLWQDVMMEGIRQLEILRGSQGVLYGSNTIAGVVSYFSNIGGADRHRLKAETGEFSTERLALTGNGARGPIDFGYAVSHMKTDGISAVKDPSGDDDGYETTTVKLVTQTEILKDVILDLVLRQSEGESEFDATSNLPPYGPADALGKGEEFSRQASRLAVTFENGNSTQEIAFNKYDAEIDSVTNFAITEGDDSSREQLSFRSTYRGEQFSFILGLEDTDISREISGTGYEANSSAASAMVIRKVGEALDITIGLREDDHQYFGSHTTYRATAALAVGNKSVVRAAHGTGFRAPTLYNLYSVYGNQDLQPETSASSELGADIALTLDTSLSFTAYQVDIEDLIEFTSLATPPYGRYMQADGTTTSKGIELSIAHSLTENVSANFATAYTDSKVPDTNGGDKRQVRVPRLQSDLGFNLLVSEGLNLSANISHVKGVVDGGVDLDDYTLLDLRAAYQINENLKANARLENAADEDYETISGYGTPGRAFYVGVTSSF